MGMCFAFVDRPSLRKKLEVKCCSTSLIDRLQENVEFVLYNIPLEVCISTKQFRIIKMCLN
jgi:hypothetical protein